MNSNTERQKKISFILFILYISLAVFAINETLTRVALLIYILGNVFLFQSIRLNKLFVGYFLFTCYFCISLLWAQGTTTVLYTLSYLVAICSLTLFMPRQIENMHDIYRYFYFYAGLMTLLVVILVIATPIRYWGTERLGANIGVNANSIGMNLVFGSLILLFIAKEQNKKILYILAVMLAVVSLFTGSRKGFVALVVGIALFYGIKNRGWKKIFFIVLGIGFAIALYKLIMENSALYEVLGKRVERFFISIFTDDYVKDNSLTKREFFREYAFDMFKQKPIFGWGAEGFRNQMIYIDYQQKAFSHCNYTEILANFGIVGFLLYYVPFVKMLFSYMKIVRNDKNSINVLFLIFCILMFILDYGCVSYYNPLTWLRYILVFSYLDIYKKENVKQQYYGGRTL
ncbi:MAG TPA: O-antigen ligase family protein [Petrimonas sp.]|nr:O-antigen ligase family protein [Petrimonas sp.]